MSQLQKDIAITSIGHFLVHSMTMILPAILIILENEFSVSLLALGQLVTIQILFLGLGGFPSGILADRFGASMVLKVYFSGLVISSVWLYFAETYFMTAIGLGLLGLITGLYHPAGLKIVSHSPNVAKYMSYHGVSGSLGLATGPIYGGVMASFYGWRIAYLFLGVPALVGLLLLLLSNNKETKSVEKVKLKFRFSKTQIIIIAVSALWSLAHHGLFNFLPYYFTDAIKIEVDAVVIGGFITGFVLLLGIVGQLVGGRLGERYKRVNLYSWIVGLNIPFLLIIAFLNGWILIAITSILGAVNFMFQPIHNSLLADVTESNQRGIIYGFSAGLSFSVGSAAGILGGFIGDIISINYIFPVISIILIPAVFLAIVLKKMV